MWRRPTGWLHSAADRRLVVAHGDVAQLLAGAREPISRNWENWIADRRVHVIESWVAELAWEDVAKALA